VSYKQIVSAKLPVNNKLPLELQKGKRDSKRAEANRLSIPMKVCLSYLAQQRLFKMQGWTDKDGKTQGKGNTLLPDLMRTKKGNLFFDKDSAQQNWKALFYGILDRSTTVTEEERNQWLALQPFGKGSEREGDYRNVHECWIYVTDLLVQKEFLVKKSKLTNSIISAFSFTSDNEAWLAANGRSPHQKAEKYVGGGF
tara:strand:- start:495 stop:1085 length:591 start_codon:yes stop_codon:yes gene_type:complete